MINRKIYNLAKEAYNLSCIVKNYTESNLDINEVLILSTAIRIMHRKIDFLYAELIQLYK